MEEDSSAPDGVGQADDNADQIVLLARLQRDRQDLLRRHARLAALRAELGAAAATASDASTLLDRAVRALLKRLDLIWARVWLTDASGDLRPGASAGADDAAAWELERLRGSAVGRVAGSGLPLHLDLDGDAALGAGSFAGYPLRGSGKAIGVLGVMGSGPLPDDTLEILRDGALLLSQSLERRRAEAEVRHTRDRLATVLATITDGVTAHHPDGRLAFANDAAARVCGLASAEEMLRLPGREILRRFEIRDEAGQLVPRDHLPFQRAQATLAPSQALLHLRQVASGEESWTLISSTQVSDTAGELIVTVYTDLTGQKRTEDAWRFLADASAILGSSLAFEVTLPQVVGLAVPRVADHCSIDRLAAGGRAELVAAAGASAGRPESEQVARVLAGGPAVLNESLILVPIVAQNQVFGSLSLACTESRRRFAAPDLTLAEEVARRAGLAIEAAGAYREVRQAVRMRDNFLSVASHELKTPLSSLTLLVSALGRTARQGRLPEMPIERLRDRLVRIEEQADRLTDLINQLLDVSRLSSGRVTLSLGLTDLSAVSAEVVGRFAEEAARAGASVSLESEGALMGVWDKSRIDQVITNLLSNAIKYGGGSAVVLSVATEGEGARLTVRDGGPGIAEEDQARIFEQYERGPTAANGFETQMNGLGLGLWIVRQLVEAHHGRVDLESRPTEGASFTVWLPRRGVTP